MHKWDEWDCSHLNNITLLLSAYREEKEEEEEEEEEEECTSYKFIRRELEIRINFIQIFFYFFHCHLFKNQIRYLRQK